MRDEWKEILEYWGLARLRRIPSEMLVSATIPHDTKQFLEHVGVVKTSTRLTNGLGYIFDEIREDKVVRLSDFFTDEVPDNMRSWVLLGHCYENVLCIESETGHIIILDGEPKTGFMDWFVNSSLQAFMHFIVLSMRSFESSKAVQGAATSLQDLKRQFKHVDAQAVANRTNWWPTILEEIEFGLI